jgi:hypothetical protein
MPVIENKKGRESVIKLLSWGDEKLKFNKKKVEGYIQIEMKINQIVSKCAVKNIDKSKVIWSLILWVYLTVPWGVHIAG